jgi:hypothetical protein
MKQKIGTTFLFPEGFEDKKSTKKIMKYLFDPVNPYLGWVNSQK